MREDDMTIAAMNSKSAGYVAVTETITVEEALRRYPHKADKIWEAVRQGVCSEGRGE